jgi:tRNA pseudouridine55 synthase
MFAILNVNKSRGASSRNAVDQIERLVAPFKAGHAGTLDPLATGVLIVCIGPATRLVRYVQQLPKRYRAEFLLGRRSASDDIEAPVELLDAPPVPTREQIVAALPNFRGRLLQRPPQFSAIKVAGRRAYRLARKGKDFHLEPRPVEIYSLDLLEFDYPRLTLDLRCGSGTYVRAVGRDLAESLGTSAVMSALARTAIGGFEVKHAVELSSLNDETIRHHLLPPIRALEALPRTEVSADDIEELFHGRFIERPNHGVDSEIAAVNDTGNLVAILKPADPNHLRPVRNFK